MVVAFVLPVRREKAEPVFNNPSMDLPFPLVFLSRYNAKKRQILVDLPGPRKIPMKSSSNFQGPENTSHLGTRDDFCRWSTCSKVPAVTDVCF